MLSRSFEQFIRQKYRRLPPKQFYRNCASKRPQKRHSISSASINVIGSGSAGDPASFILRTNGPCYLFNCGGGTDRIARCNRLLRWANIENIFLTRIDWSRIGGMLAGLSEITQNGDSSKLTVHGPGRLQPIIERMCSIIGMPEPSVKFNCTESYVAPGLRIDMLPLSNDNDNVAYTCKLKAYNGRLNLEKCVDLDIPATLIKKLSLYESISLPDGRTITQHDVYDFIDDEKNFIVVDIPSLDYLSSLEQCEAFNTFLDSVKLLEVAVHLSPPHILDSPDYKRFLERTKAQRHLVLNESNKFSGLIAVHRRQIQFNQLNNEIFPLLNSSVDPNPMRFDGRDKAGDGTVHNVSTNTIFTLRKYRNDREEEETINLEASEDVVEESVPGTYVANDGVKANRSTQFPKIVFLGTSSQRSGITRNVSSILVHTSEYSCILLDCGEDTYGQIIRFYGTEAMQILAKIKAIFISHLHGDHHYGLFDVLSHRKRAGLSNRPRILLMIPCEQFTDWITFCSEHIENVTNEFQFIDNNDLSSLGAANHLLAHLDLGSLQTCAVDHITSSFGISITASGCNGNAPFKLTYSGDTVPCDSLVQLGQNSTLLIHEATFENTLLDRAQQTKHCTISQAIEQSVKMNAKYTVLTHFSQRYPILPWIDGDLAANIGIAFDNMELVEEDLSKLSALHPRMKTMFANHFKQVERMAAIHKERQIYQNQL